jgi:hypothetical protein
MNSKQLVIFASVAAALAGCESGDIVLQPTTVDNSTSTGGGGGAAPTNPCALYTQSGQTRQGTLDADNNCVYDSLFVSATRPITVDQVTFPALPNGGLHIFEDSLLIGEDVDANDAATGKRIPQEGEGTQLIIAPGATMVFRRPDTYVGIRRGSQIFAEGTADAPITFTADEDALLGISTENDRGLWGGVQINGNGRTNKCSDGTATGTIPGTDQFAPTGNNVHNCHVAAEGRPTTYGGNNNAENSGVLTYVVIKHAGFEVVDGDELNGLTLNAVGNGTTISYVQAYSTQDDGFEMFGGAVDLDHIVALNAGDDSIDYSEGYNGDIQYAVAVHSSGANRCIEADNGGENRADSFTPTTKLRISNLTCVVTNVDANAGSNPSSKGDAEGPLFREGAYFEMYNSLVASSDPSMLSNECIEIEDTEGPQSIDAAQAGTSVAKSNLIACSEAVKTGIVNAANAGFNFLTWLAGGDGSPQIPTNGNTNNVVENANLPANVLDGAAGTRRYLTASALTNSASAVLFDQATQLFDVTTLPDSAYFENPTYLGGANAGDDWLAGWTVGFDLPLAP